MCSTVNSAQWYSEHCAVYSIQYTMYSVQFTEYNVYRVYSTSCLVCSRQWSEVKSSTVWFAVWLVSNAVEVNGKSLVMTSALNIVCRSALVCSVQRVVSVYIVQCACMYNLQIKSRYRAEEVTGKDWCIVCTVVQCMSAQFSDFVYWCILVYYKVY